MGLADSFKSLVHYHYSEKHGDQNYSNRYNNTILCSDMEKGKRNQSTNKHSLNSLELVKNCARYWRQGIKKMKEKIIYSRK